MEQFKQKYIEEANELIQDLESACLSLNSERDNQEHVEKLFRAMHSLKGGSAMFGFDLIDGFTHQLETAYDMVRQNILKVDENLLDLSFQSIDHIKNLLEQDNEVTDTTMEVHRALLEKISALVSDDKPSAQPPGNIPAEQKNSKEQTYFIKFNPYKDIFRNGTNPLLIVNELVSLGRHAVMADTSRIPAFEEFDAAHCYTGWTVIVSTEAPEDEIHDVFMFVDLECELEIRKFNFNAPPDEDFFRLAEEKFYKEGTLNFDDLDAFRVKEAPAPETQPKNNGNDSKASHKDHGISSIRVSSEKLDELINLVSELVTRQASLSLMAEKIADKDLLPVSEDIDKISRRLRDTTFSIRLIPVESMEIRFRRLVREQSAHLNKEIDFQTEGTDTELDKNIIEKLLDPMLHIIRNSIDHGIETAEERMAAGKPRKGTIRLKAFYSGANVFIQVSDDGRGMSRENILKKAMQNGLVDEDAQLTDKEILDLVFLPGFSTADNVTSLSGRGVGMDVVRRKISELRSEVSIDSEEGKGTTITIKLPLTLSIIDGLLVKIDATHYVIPLVSTNKCYEYSHEELKGAVNNLIHVNEGHIPFAYLRKEFGITTDPPAREQVVVVEHGESMFGLVVDNIIGEYQAVLKSLGQMYEEQEIVSGATILGDGTVALVLDPNKIIDEFAYVD